MTLLKIKNFLVSLWFHIYRGFPKATKLEILQRYNICSACTEFDKIRSECSVCGCRITTKRQFMNKLAWADQSCPLSKWTEIKRN
jgi:uncharacterized paraquat-inducible protein A